MENRQKGQVTIWFDEENMVSGAINAVDYDEFALTVNVAAAIAAASTKANLLTVLGVSTYVDNAAALTASVPVGTVYYASVAAKLMSVLAGA